MVNAQDAALIDHAALIERAERFLSDRCLNTDVALEDAIGTNVYALVQDLLTRLTAEPQGWQETAWVLIERRNGIDHTEGIALTHADKEAFVRGWFEPGQSRSALPYTVFPAPPPVTP
jgi:hypothetical protein